MKKGRVFFIFFQQFCQSLERIPYLYRKGKGLYEHGFEVASSVAFFYLLTIGFLYQHLMAIVHKQVHETRKK